MDGAKVRNIGSQGFVPPRIPGRTIGIGILVLVALWTLLSSVYRVDVDEQALVLRFGKHVRTTERGLHFKLPRPIESVIKVAVQRQLKEEFGFRTEDPGTRTRYSAQSFVISSVPALEVMMMTVFLKSISRPSPSRSVPLSKTW